MAKTEKYKLGIYLGDGFMHTEIDITKKQYNEIYNQHMNGYASTDNETREEWSLSSNSKIEHYNGFTLHSTYFDCGISGIGLYKFVADEGYAFK